MPERPASLDEFLRRLGQPGRYQALVAVLLCFNYVPIALSQTLTMFYGHTPPHNCRLPEHWTPERSLPSSGPADAPVFDQCRMYVDPANHTWGTKECIYGYQFHVQKLEWNAVTEWGLVCDRQYLVQLIATLYLVGAILGGLALGVLSDRFGRQPIMLLCLYTQLILGVGLFFVRRLVVFITLRTLQGFFVQGLEGTSFALLFELVPAEYRPAVAAAGQLCWGLGVLLLTLCQYFVRHWRYVQLAISIPSVVTLLYIWLIPESLAWLVAQQLRRRARLVVARVARYNGLRVGTELLAHLDKVFVAADEGAGENEETVKAAGSNRRRDIAVLMLVWLCFSVSVAGVQSRPLQLSSVDRFAQRALEGAAHALGAVLAYGVARRRRRRASLAAALALTGALALAIVAAERFLDASAVDVSMLVTSLLLLARAAAVSSRCCLLLSTAELAPVGLRALLLGGGLLLAEAGRLLTPRLQLIMATSPDWTPFLVFGCLSIGGGLIALLLPDLLQQPPPKAERLSSVEDLSEVEPDQRYFTTEGPRSLSSDVQRHIHAVPQTVSTTGIGDSQSNGEVLNVAFTGRNTARTDSASVRERESDRQVRESKTYRVVTATRRPTLQHQNGQQPRGSVAPSSLCSCSCYSTNAGAGPILLTGDNVTMRPRYGSVANTLSSYGQYCPYCVNSLRQKGVMFRGELSGAARTPREASPPRAQVREAPVDYDVPPRTRRVPWWKRGTDPATHSMIERCVVDGRIETIQRNGANIVPYVAPEVQEPDLTSRGETSDGASPSESSAASTDGASPASGVQRQNVGTHGLFTGPDREPQPAQRDSRNSPKVGRGVDRREARRVGIRQGNALDSDDRAINMPVQRSLGGPAGGIVRLVISRVGA